MPRVRPMSVERNSKYGRANLGAPSFAALVVAAACTASRPPSPRPAPVASMASAGGSRTSAPAPATSATEPDRIDGEPILLVTDPAVVATLERKGFAFGDIVGERGTGPVDNARLALETRYASV